MSEMADGLRVEELVVKYGGQEAVHDASFHVPSGTIFGLVGRSGSGKTSILRSVGGYVRPVGGQITVGDQDITHVPASARDFGMVFQGYALFQHMTVKQNIAFGLKARHLNRQEIEARIGEVVELTELGSLMGRYPRQLSGGQQQRVALARALAIKPRVLLLDEPLGALDAQLRESLLIGIKQIQSELQITTLYVTHDQREAFMICDRMAVVNNGRLVAIGAPEQLYECPPTSFAATFIGNGTLFPLDITALRRKEPLSALPGQTTPVRLTAPISDGTAAAFVFLRPEAIFCSASPVAGATSGHVLWRRYQGRDTLVGVKVEGRDAVILAHADSSIEVGAVVGIWWDPARATVIEEAEDGASLANETQLLMPVAGDAIEVRPVGVPVTP